MQPHIPENAVFEYDLSKHEIAMFEKLLEMEAVHNEIAINLSAYKDSIMDLRNKFVIGITTKYGIEKPSLVTYDPLTRKIVSAFHPNVKANKIVGRPYAFKKVASEIMISAIKQLTEIFGAMEKRG